MTTLAPPLRFDPPQLTAFDITPRSADYKAHQLVSLWEMLEFYAREFLALGGLLRHMQRSPFDPGEQAGQEHPDARNMLLAVVAMFQEVCGKLGMNVTAGLAGEMLSAYEH